MAQLNGITFIEDHYVQIDVDSANKTTVFLHDDGTIRIVTYGKVENLQSKDTRDRGTDVTTVSFTVGNRD